MVNVWTLPLKEVPQSINSLIKALREGYARVVDMIECPGVVGTSQHRYYQPGNITSIFFWFFMYFK